VQHRPSTTTACRTLTIVTEGAKIVEGCSAMDEKTSTVSPVNVFTTTDVNTYHSLGHGNCWLILVPSVLFFLLELLGVDIPTKNTGGAKMSHQLSSPRL